jgi:hypothetical protein
MEDSSERKPCSNPNCTGIINEEGYCGTCGKHKDYLEQLEYDDYRDYDEDEYDEDDVGKEFWERNKERCVGYSQYEPLLRKLLKKIQKLKDDQNLESWEYRQKLADAEEVVDDITFSFKYNWDNAPKEKFWWGWGNMPSFEKPKEWSEEASPIDGDNLDKATAKYLAEPWMQLNKLDWYIINAFVIDEILRLGDGIRSGEAFGEIKFVQRMSYSLSEGKPLRTLLWKIGLNIFLFILNWLLLPIIAVVAYIYNYFEVAKWVAIIFAVQVLYNIVISPWRIIHWRRLRILKKTLVKKLERLIQIYLITHVQTINPSVLRNKIVELEKEGVLIKPAVYSILDRAIQRDSAVFTAD